MKLSLISTATLVAIAVQPANGIFCFFGLFGPCDNFQEQIDQLKADIASLMGPQATEQFDSDTSLGVEDGSEGLTLRDAVGLRIAAPTSRRARKSQ